MRRKDREITDANTIATFIAKEQILRIAFYDAGDIYIVPINYGYSYDEQYTFYFHGAKDGRKYNLAKKQPTVGFEIDGNYTLLEGEMACDFSATFQSVVGTGTLSLVEDTKEKIKGLNAIMKQTTSKEQWDYSEEMLEAVAVFRLDVEKMSCKAKL
ncbi:MAG: pyridoxamine 5'-phosphate oxidase family protein [Lachnospiraceae bacterium]|nr:pyridoxamine 5'-phosphate oxidase family protein [Lachnospiraceae bacterium]